MTPTITYQNHAIPVEAAGWFLHFDRFRPNVPVTLRRGAIPEAFLFALACDQTAASDPDDETQAWLDGLWDLEATQDSADTLVEALARHLDGISERLTDENPHGVWLPSWNDPGCPGLHGWLSDLIDAEQVAAARGWLREARLRAAVVAHSALSVADRVAA